MRHLSCFLCAFASVAVADPLPVATPVPENMLPTSAVRRLGTTRFRPGQQQTVLTFSPNGRWLASAGYDGQVHIWEIATGREVASFSFQYNQVSTIRFSPDNSMLAAGGYDSQIRVWNTSEWNEVTPPPPAQRNFDPPLFDWLPGSKTIVRLSRDGRLRIHEAVSGKELQSWQFPQLNVTSFACRPDGKIAVAQGNDFVLRAWDLTTGQELKHFEVSPNPNNVYRSNHRLHFSEDGKTLAATESERTLVTWNADTGKLIRRFEVPGYFQAMALSPNGRVMATSGGDSSVRLWGVASGRELRTFDTPRESSTALQFSPNGKMLVSAGAAVLRFWDLDNDRELFGDLGHRGTIQGLAFLNGSKQIVSMASDYSLRVWNPATGAEIDRLTSIQYYYGSAMVSSDGGRSVLFPASSTGIQRWTPSVGRVQSIGLTMQGGTVPMLSPDGQTAAAVWGTAYRIYDVVSGAEIRTFEAPEHQSNVHSLSADRRYFAAAHGYRDQFSAAQVTVFEISTGRKLRPLAPPQPQPIPAVRLAFSPDCRFVVVVYNSGETRVWELATGLSRVVIAAPERTANGRTTQATAALFTPDSRCLVLGFASGELVVCELDRREPFRVQAHRAPIAAVACASDGRLLVTGSSDTSILVFDLPDLRRRTPQFIPAIAAPSAADLESAWNLLGSTDEKDFGTAVASLIAWPSQTVAMLEEKLKPIRGPTEDEVRQWVSQLGDTRFATREKASKNLSLAGENARVIMTQALAAPPQHAEARRRLEVLLRRLDDGLIAPRLQPIRAVEVLERIGTDQARKVLEKLNAETTEVLIKHEIEHALKRLKS
jgi:WD40 repeat protein